MNIEIFLKVTCDQTGQVIHIPEPIFGPLVLTDTLRKLLKRGWSVSSWRGAPGTFNRYELSASGFRLVQIRPDGGKLEIKSGLSRTNLWITAPDVDPDPPFTKTALIQRESQAKFEVEPSRIQSLESQVAYLSAQISRLSEKGA